MASNNAGFLNDNLRQDWSKISFYNGVANTNFNPWFFQMQNQSSPMDQSVLDKVTTQRDVNFQNAIIGTAVKPWKLNPQGNEGFSNNQMINSEYYSNPARTEFKDSFLSFLFFSEQNVKNLQQLIRFMVFKKSKINIDDQDEITLYTIMRAKFIEYQNHPPLFSKYDTEQQRRDKIKMYVDEVNRLNKMVVDYSVPKIVSYCYLYYDYLERTKNPLPVPLARPLNISSTGTRTYRTATQVLLGGTF